MCRYILAHQVLTIAIFNIAFFITDVIMGINPSEMWNLGLNLQEFLTGSSVFGTFPQCALKTTWTGAGMDSTG